MKHFFLSLKKSYAQVVDDRFLKWEEAAYFLKFIILLLSFYYFNMFFVGVTDPRGLIYNAFLDHYLDYISWLRIAILQMANLIDQSLGVPSYIADSYTLRVAHGPGVRLGFPCLGYGVMSFWIAFIGAQQGRWKRSLIWMAAGVTGIWLINCIRVALLLIALKKRWQVNKYINQHDLFNIVAYLLILVLICVYYKNSKQKAANRPCLG